MGQKYLIIEEREPIPFFLIEAMIIAGYGAFLFVGHVHFVLCIFIFFGFLVLLLAILSSNLGFQIWAVMSAIVWSWFIGQFVWRMTWDWVWTLFIGGIVMYLVFVGQHAMRGMLFPAKRTE